MSVIKTLLIGTLALVGGCTVLVGSCTVGVTKAAIGTIETSAAMTEASHFNKLYDRSPSRAKKKYKEVATECYETTMQAALGVAQPKHVIEERVRFDIYEIELKKSGDEKNIKYLPTWRDQSNKKIVASIENKTQKRAVKRYLKKTQKGNLLESVCIANKLTPKEAPRSRTTKLRKASYRK